MAYSNGQGLSVKIAGLSSSMAAEAYALLIGVATTMRNKDTRVFSDNWKDPEAPQCPT